MRRLLIRSGFSLLGLAILAVASIVAGPWWARALDAIHTTRLATVTSLSIRKYAGFFHFFPGRDGTPLPEAEGFTWYDWGNPLESVGIQLDPGGVLVLIDSDHHFVLGRCPCAIEGDRAGVGRYHLDHPRSRHGELANTVPYHLLRLARRRQQLVSLGT